MKQFVYEVFFFSICTILALLFVFFASYIFAKPNDYTAAIIDKHYCMQQTSSRRIVFVGDSNLTFGLDSELIEKEFDYRVCNLGLHGGFGLNFILSEAKDLLKPNDVVILITAWNLGSGTPALRSNAQVFLPRSAFYSYGNSFYDNIKTMAAVPYFILRKDLNRILAKNTSHVYFRDGFNKQGDLIRHLDTNRYEQNQISFDSSNRYEIPWNAKEYLQEVHRFQQVLESQNINFFYTFPPYPNTLYIKDQERFETYENHVRAVLKMSVLGNNQSFIFNDSMFFDSEYHLNKEGRILRTKILIDLLRPMFWSSVNGHFFERQLSEYN